jgi:hypothetical protein
MHGTENIKIAFLVNIEVDCTCVTLIFNPRNSELPRNFAWESRRKYILTGKQVNFVEPVQLVTNVFI